VVANNPHMIQKPKRHGVILPRLIESNLVNQPLTIQDSALLCTPRGLAGYSRRRPRLLLARRSQAIRPGPRLSSTIAPGARTPIEAREGMNLVAGRRAQAPRGPRPSADG